MSAPSHSSPKSTRVSLHESKECKPSVLVNGAAHESPGNKFPVSRFKNSRISCRRNWADFPSAEATAPDPINVVTGKASSGNVSTAPLRSIMTISERSCPRRGACVSLSVILFTGQVRHLILPNLRASEAVNTQLSQKYLRRLRGKGNPVNTRRLRNSHDKYPSVLLRPVQCS